MQRPFHIPFHNFSRFEQLVPGIEAQFIEEIAAEGCSQSVSAPASIMSPEAGRCMRPAAPWMFAALFLALVAGAAQPAWADGDAGRGRKVYERWCAGCHAIGGATRPLGPDLAGLIGRRAGTVAGTPYGKNLYEASIVWDEASLDRYLASPADAVHGTIMPVGVHDATERTDLIAFLKTLK
jgi:cytochrome c